MRRANFGAWSVRIKLKTGKYCQKRFALADDDRPADGERVLTFAQALKAAEEWCEANSDIAIEKVLSWEDRIEFPPLSEAPPYLVGHALKAYLEWYRDNRKGFSSAYYSARSSLFEYFWEMPFSELTSTKIKRWMFQQTELPPRLRTRRGAPQDYFPKQENDWDFIRRRRATVNRHLHLLRAALFQGLERGMTENDAAWVSIRGYRGVHRNLIRFLEKEQIGELLKNCPPYLATLVSGAVLTGCRLGELRRMKVRAFDLELKLLEVDDQKTNQVRKIYLAPEAYNFFLKLTKDREADSSMFRGKNGLAWHKGSQWRPFKLACSQAGLPATFRFHELRHTYASHAVMAGVPLKVVATQLGHTDTRTVDKFYSRMGNEYVASVIEERMPIMLPDHSSETAE